MGLPHVVSLIKSAAVLWACPCAWTIGVWTCMMMNADACARPSHRFCPKREIVCL